MPERLCNLDRLLAELEANGLDGLIAYTRTNVFYLSHYSPPSVQSIDENQGLGAFIISRHEPHHPVLIIPEIDVATIAAETTWIDDVRAYASSLLPMDIPVEPYAIDRFMPATLRDSEWGQAIRQNYFESLADACNAAIRDLRLEDARVGFDNLRFPGILGFGGQVVDAYQVMKSVRWIKTEEEIALLRTAAAVNQATIESLIPQWTPGMTWRELNTIYHVEAIKRGGFIHDPGALVLANLAGADPAFVLGTGFEDSPVDPGMHIMFDCHGTINHYCWDGGKTWVVADEPSGLRKRIAKGVGDATEEMLLKLRPGMLVSELQAIARGTLRKHGLSESDRAMIYFHGVGLSHQDQVPAANAARGDWPIEDNSVIALHLYYPGGDRERFYMEEICQVTHEGGQPFFTWGFDPLVG